MARNYIIFQISTNKAIIDIKNTQEIIVRPSKITNILDSELYVEGLIDLRGEPIAIVDLRTFLNVPKYNPDELKDEQTILIMKKDNKKLGIIVDKIYHVEEMNVSDETAVDSMEEPENSLYNAYFPKVIRVEKELLSVFNAEKFFKDTNKETKI